MRNAIARVKGVYQAAFVALVACLLAPGLAMAQTGDVEFDPAPALAIVASAKDFIVEIGIAVLVLIMVAKGIKWARKAG